MTTTYDLPEVYRSGDNFIVDGFPHDRPNDVSAYRNRAIRMLALVDHLDHQESAPLKVGDRVRVVTPKRADGEEAVTLAAGDVGTVVKQADWRGDIRFQRAGTSGWTWVDAVNVERIEDEEPITARSLNFANGTMIAPPRVGDTVRVDKAEMELGTRSGAKVGGEYEVTYDHGDGDLTLGGCYIVAARNVTIVRRADA